MRTMRRIFVSLVVVMVVASGVLAFLLLSEPRNVDVSDCKTKWKNGRITSVVCPGGGIPG